MKTILIILVAILIVGFIAYMVVNKIPKKLRPIISLLLWVLTIFLGYLIYESIMAPIEFNKEKEARYAKVIHNLKMIRDAEVAHKDITGDYTDNKLKLIEFIDTAKYAITEVKNVVETQTKGAITVEVEVRKVDTIGFKDVRADFAGRNYKEMFQIPGTNQEFVVQVGKVEKVQGLLAPVFLVEVDKAIILEGLNEDFIRQEKEALGGVNVRGAYISVGSLDDVKTSGNWPPSYDTAEERTKKKE